MKGENFSKKYSKGFTLVESMVAIVLFVAAVTGTLTAIQGGLRDSNIAKENMIAFYLAQEGMEFIKNTRDNNALRNLSGTNTSWLAGLTSVTTDPCWYGGGGTAQKTCHIDAVYSPQVTNCAGGVGTCPNLTTETATGLYTQRTGAGFVASNFKRELRFTSVRIGEVVANITISWTFRGVTRSFTATETFFDR